MRNIGKATRLLPTTFDKKCEERDELEEPGLVGLNCFLYPSLSEWQATLTLRQGLKPT